MRRRAWLLALVAAAVAACNALTGLSDEFRLASADLDGGDDGSPSSDAHPEGETAPPDARDAAATDAADARSDARTFCVGASATTIFCTDFESPSSAPSWGWSGTDLVSGTVAVEDGVGRWGSRGLHASVQNAPGTSRHAALVEMFAPAAAGHYDVSFDFDVKTNALDYVALGILGFNVAATTNYYGVAMHNHAFFDNTDPPKPTDNVGYDASPGPAWHTATIVLDSVGSSFTASLTVDGLVCDTTPGIVTMGAPLELHVGAFFSGTVAGTAEIYVDNVVVHRN